MVWLFIYLSTYRPMIHLALYLSIYLYFCYSSSFFSFLSLYIFDTHLVSFHSFTIWMMRRAFHVDAFSARDAASSIQWWAKCSAGCQCFGPSLPQRIARQKTNRHLAQRCTMLLELWQFGKFAIAMMARLRRIAHIAAWLVRVVALKCRARCWRTSSMAHSRLPQTRIRKLGPLSTVSRITHLTEDSWRGNPW